MKTWSSMYLLRPQTVNPVQARKGSFLIMIGSLLKSNYFSNEEGNEKEVEIVWSIEIHPHQ